MWHHGGQRETRIAFVVHLRDSNHVSLIARRAAFSSYHQHVILLATPVCAHHPFFIQQLHQFVQTANEMRAGAARAPPEGEATRGQLRTDTRRHSCSLSASIWLLLRMQFAHSVISIQQRALASCHVAAVICARLELIKRGESPWCFARFWMWLETISPLKSRFFFFLPPHSFFLLFTLFALR